MPWQPAHPQHCRQLPLCPADFLTANFDIIMIPWFDSQRMSRRAYRRILSKMVRSMMSWCHRKFRLKLAYMAEERACAVLFVSEAYTSKTCTNCGRIKHNLGGSKVFKCTCCCVRLDRDGGCRNILLPTMLKMCSLSFRDQLCPIRQKLSCTRGYKHIITSPNHRNSCCDICWMLN